MLWISARRIERGNTFLFIIAGQPLIERNNAMIQDEVKQALSSAFRDIRDGEASLNQRLATYTKSLERYLPSYAQAVESLIARLQTAGTGAAAPAVGDPMPPFLLPDENGHLVSLADLLSQGPAAIIFTRGHWCPYCRLTAHALASADDRLRPLGRRIASITPERQSFAKMQLAEANASYPMLSDSGNGYALSLNLVIWLGDEVTRAMTELGRDLGAYQSDPSWFVPIPATFVLARDATITARFIDPDYRQRMDIDTLIDALTAAT